MFYMENVFHFLLLLYLSSSPLVYRRGGYDEHSANCFLDLVCSIDIKELVRSFSLNTAVQLGRLCTVFNFIK